jgi:hypothetical protein
VEERDGVVLARRARLLARIDAWNEETSRELARSCAAVIAQLAAEHPHDDLLQRRARTIPEIADGPDPSATARDVHDGGRGRRSRRRELLGRAPPAGRVAARAAAARPRRGRSGRTWD